MRTTLLRAGGKKREKDQGWCLKQHSNFSNLRNIKISRFPFSTIYSSSFFCGCSNHSGLNHYAPLHQTLTPEKPSTWMWGTKLGGQRGHWEDKMTQGKARDVTRAQVRVQGTTQATEIHLLRSVLKLAWNAKLNNPGRIQMNKDSRSFALWAHKLMLKCLLSLKKLHLSSLIEIIPFDVSCTSFFIPVIVRCGLKGHCVIGLLLERLLNCMYVAYFATFAKPGAHLPRH